MLGKFALAAVAAFLGGTAQASPVDQIIGNTILSTYPDGRAAKLWLYADGSYSGEGRSGDLSAGRWLVRRDQLCLKQFKPIPSFVSFCASVPPNGLRDGWTRKAITGETIKVHLVHGQLGGPQGHARAVEVAGPSS